MAFIIEFVPLNVSLNSLLTVLLLLLLCIYTFATEFKSLSQKVLDDNVGAR